MSYLLAVLQSKSLGKVILKSMDCLLVSVRQLSGDFVYLELPILRLEKMAHRLSFTTYESNK